MGNNVYIWIAELIMLSAAVFAFIYGLRNFFQKGRPLFLQSITMAMGCHSLGSLYYLCQLLTNASLIEGFTPAYLGRIGFFLFFITASYGHMDRIVDDGSRAIMPSRYLALAAPVCAALLYIPTLMNQDMLVSGKAADLLVWLTAAVSVYYNLKHAIIPDCDFGFIKAIKPYNTLSVCLGFSELLFLSLRNSPYGVCLVIISVIFAVLCVATMLAAKRGAEKWII